VSPLKNKTSPPACAALDFHSIFRFRCLAFLISTLFSYFLSKRFRTIKRNKTKRDERRPGKFKAHPCVGALLPSVQVSVYSVREGIHRGVPTAPGSFLKKIKKSHGAILDRVHSRPFQSMNASFSPSPNINTRKSNTYDEIHPGVEEIVFGYSKTDESERTTD